MFLACAHTNTQNSKLKEQEESFGGDGYVYYLDYDDGITVYVYVQTHQVVYIKYVPYFAYQLYCSVLVKKKKKRTRKYSEV